MPTIKKIAKPINPTKPISASISLFKTTKNTIAKRNNVATSFHNLILNEV